jgi:hypothetical protein
MQSERVIFGKLTVRRAIALAACVVLFYYAAGGAFLHKHKTGDETPCHLCQSLQTPTLTASAQALLSTPCFIAWYASQPVNLSAGKLFSLHRAGRAPPSI